MNLTPVLDTAIALVFIYVVLSLVSIAVNELIVRFISLRSRMLRRGLQDLLTDRREVTLIDEIFEHHMVKGLQGMEREFLLFGKKSPTGIPNRNFARALVQVLAERNRVRHDGDVERASKMVREAKDPEALKMAREALARAEELRDKGLFERFGDEVRQSTIPAIRALLPLLEESDNKESDNNKALSTLREKLEEWFDQSTKSLTEFYRNQTKLIALMVGFALAVAFNADTFYMAKELWHDSSMRSAIVAQAASTVAEEVPFDTTFVPKDSIDSAVVRIMKVHLNQKGRDLIAKIDSMSLPLGWRCAAETVVSVEADTNKDCTGTVLKDDTTRTDAVKTVRPGYAGSKSWWVRTFGWLFAAESPGSRKPWVRMFGWLFTAAAVSMGAPFWYDLLGRLVGSRASLKSKEKTQT